MLVNTAPAPTETHRLSAVKLLAQSCPANRALRRSPKLGLAHVSCELREGMAILHGKVSSFYLKQVAQELVKKVDEVKMVVNQISVG